MAKWFHQCNPSNMRANDMKSNFVKRRRQGKDSFPKRFPLSLTWCPSAVTNFKSIGGLQHFLSFSSLIFSYLILSFLFCKWPISLKKANVDNNKLTCQLSTNVLTFLSELSTIGAVSNRSRITVAMATRGLVRLPAFAFNLESGETWRL